MTKARLTEAQMLREYFKIKQVEQALNATKLRELVYASNLKPVEAVHFFALAEQMEKEAIK